MMVNLNKMSVREYTELGYLRQALERAHCPNKLIDKIVNRCS